MSAIAGAETAEQELQLTSAYDMDITETDEAAMFIRVCKDSEKKLFSNK